MKKVFKITFTILKAWLFIGCVLFGMFFFMFDSIRTGTFWNETRENFLLYYLPIWFFIFVICGVLTLVLFFINRIIEKTVGNRDDLYEQQYKKIHEKNAKQYDQLYAEWKEIKANSPDSNDKEPEKDKSF